MAKAGIIVDNHKVKTPLRPKCFLPLPKEHKQGRKRTVKKYAIGLYEKAMPPSLSWREKLTFAR